jgi:hypothetical protein
MLAVCYYKQRLSTLSIYCRTSDAGVTSNKKVELRLAILTLETMEVTLIVLWGMTPRRFLRNVPPSLPTP